MDIIEQCPRCLSTNVRVRLTMLDRYEISCYECECVTYRKIIGGEEKNMKINRAKSRRIFRKNMDPEIWKQPKAIKKPKKIRKR